MNTKIKIFDNPTFGSIRVVNSNESEPLFCLADVCVILGLLQGDVKRRLDDGVVSTQPIIDSMGRNQLANFVNEDGLYDVILDSRKPEARKFRKWVTSEVLPSIRKDGGYIATSVDDTPEVILARAVVVAQESIKRFEEQLKAEREKRKNAEHLYNIMEGQNEQLEKVNATLAPKAEYTDKVLQSMSTFTTTQIAQGLGLSANALNVRLKNLGIQYKQSNQWILTCKYKDKEYATNRVHIYRDADGDTKTTQTLVWTERGREFIHGLRKQNYI